jgi:hypothetical protein
LDLQGHPPTWRSAHLPEEVWSDPFRPIGNWREEIMTYC